MPHVDGSSMGTKSFIVYCFKYIALFTLKKEQKMTAYWWRFTITDKADFEFNASQGRGLSTGWLIAKKKTEKSIMIFPITRTYIFLFSVIWIQHNGNWWNNSYQWTFPAPVNPVQVINKQETIFFPLTASTFPFHLDWGMGANLAAIGAKPFVINELMKMCAFLHLPISDPNDCYCIVVECKHSFFHAFRIVLESGDDF